MIHVLDHAILRVAAWPIERLDGIRSPQLANLAVQLIRQRDAYQEACKKLAQSLTGVVPRLGRDSRRLALTARRAAHRGSATPVSEEFRAEIQLYSADCAALLDETAALRATCAKSEHAYARAAETAAANERQALFCLAADPAFDRALAFANPVIARRARAAVTADGPALKVSADRRLHASLLGYALRAAGRPTPLGAWAGVTEVVPAPVGADRLQVTDVRPQHRVSIDMRPFLSLLREQVTTENGRRIPIRLVGRAPAGKAGWDVTWLECDGVMTSVESLMARTGLAFEEICAEVRRGLNGGWLAVVQPYDTASDAWQALRCLGAPLTGEPARSWSDLVDTAHHACQRLEQDWQTIGSAEVAARDGPLRETFRRAGVIVPAEAPLFIVDTTAAVRMTWDESSRARITKALEEAFRLLAADGSAEQFRRDLVHVNLLGRRPPRRESPSPDVTRFPWTHGAPSQEREAVQRWHVLLHHRWRDRSVDVPAQMLASSACAGPAGDHLVTIDGAGRIWLLRGRPQPGMFAGRHDDLLRGPDETTSAYWRCLSARLQDDWLPDPIDIALERPAAPTTAFRPPMGERWTSGRVRAASLLLDADLRAWILDADRTARLPLYTSAAAPAGDDPDDRLALAIAFSHGWEYLSIGFPPLPEELSTWHHLPRLSLPCSAVISPRRWTLTSRTVSEIEALARGDRFVAWQKRMGSWEVPTWVCASFGTDPDDAPLPLPTDSITVAEYLLRRAAARAEPIVLTELPQGSPATLDLRDGTHRTELAVSWVADDYRRPRSERQGIAAT